MTMNKDELKGRSKEAAGAATGDKGLKREGEIDQLAGKAKKAVDKAAKGAKAKVHKHA
jgi:uncharacterized protein YjbJ (UPF0337 family)